MSGPLILLAIFAFSVLGMHEFGAPVWAYFMVMAVGAIAYDAGSWTGRAKERREHL
jgi:hypothetical protein